MPNARTLVYVPIVLGWVVSFAVLLSPMAIAANQGVVVATDKSRYCLSEPITVTIANRLRETLYAYSGQSYCTIVEVHRVDGDKPKIIGACVAGAPPSRVEIAGMTERKFKLDRFDPVFEPMGPGTYRIRFCYRRGTIDAAESCTESAQFAVRECPDG